MMGQLSNHHMHSRFMRLHGVLGEIESQTATPPLVHRQAQRRLRPTEIEQLIAAYSDGVSLKELAERFRTHWKTVSQVLKREGIPRRYRKLSPENISTAISLYEKGKSLAVVAAHFDVHPGALLPHFRRAGVTMRDTHGRER
jgi:hypothetical protein